MNSGIRSIRCTLALRPTCHSPLGFELNEKEVKRAGLDHWQQVDLAVHDSW